MAPPVPVDAPPPVPFPVPPSPPRPAGAEAPPLPTLPPAAGLPLPPSDDIGASKPREPPPPVPPAAVPLWHAAAVDTSAAMHSHAEDFIDLTLSGGSHPVPSPSLRI